MRSSDCIFHHESTSPPSNRFSGRVSFNDPWCSRDVWSRRAKSIVYCERDRERNLKIIKIILLIWKSPLYMDMNVCLCTRKIEVKMWECEEVYTLCSEPELGVVIRKACVWCELSWHAVKSSEKICMRGSIAGVSAKWCHSEGACPLWDELTWCEGERGDLHVGEQSRCVSERCRHS